MLLHHVLTFAIVIQRWCHCRGEQITMQPALISNSLSSLMYSFSPRDSYAKRGICRRRVSLCVSVCVCVYVCHTPVLYQNG